MKILIDAAEGRGYRISFESDEGETRTYGEVIYSLRESMDYAYLMAEEIEGATGEWIEPLISAAAIRVNKDFDIDARKLWNTPEFRAAIPV